MSASAVGKCVCSLVVVVGLALGGTSLCGSSGIKNWTMFWHLLGGWYSEDKLKDFLRWVRRNGKKRDSCLTRKGVVKCRIEWKSQVHQGICLETILAVFRGDNFDLENAIQKKAEFSYAIAVMDKIAGWWEENWVGSSLAASMWISTKAVFCVDKTTCRTTGSSNWSLSWKPWVVNWVYDDALDEHVWVSELTISFQEAKVLEALKYDMENPCMVQREMLWFSAPTNLNGCLHFAFLEDEFSKMLLLRSIRTVLVNTPERESGTWKEIWWDGTGLETWLVVWQMETVTTTRILRTNETLEISELGDAISLKRWNEGVPVLLPIANARDIEIKGAKEFDSIWGSHDKEKLELVIKRMANVFRMAVLLCWWRWSKLSEPMEKAGVLGEMARGFQHSGRGGNVGEGQED